MGSPWTITKSSLVNLTPARARDLIVDCFFFAQRETLARIKQQLGSTRTDGTSLHKDVIGMVQLAFKEVGAEYHAPTVESLDLVVEVLMRRAASWGTPLDIVQHHGSELRRLLDHLGRATKSTGR